MVDQHDFTYLGWAITVDLKDGKIMTVIRPESNSEDLEKRIIRKGIRKLANI